MPCGSLLIVYMRRDYSFRFHKMCNIEQMGLANGSLQCIAAVALGADDESMTVTSTSPFRNSGCIKLTVRTWNGYVSSHIHGGHDVGDASVEKYFAARDLHVDQAAMLLFVFPEFLYCVKYWFLQYFS